MPKITFLPINVTHEGKEGDSILDVALENNVPMQHACGGFCACATCQVEVESGAENLTSQEDDELDRLEDTAGQKTPQSRLGCQSKLKSGDVTVKIVNLE